MIYIINNKPHVKVQDFFAEVEVLKDRMIPAKNFKKIYVQEVNEADLKKYNSIEEYNKILDKNIDRSFEINRESEKQRRTRIK